MVRTCLSFHTHKLTSIVEYHNQKPVVRRSEGGEEEWRWWHSHILTFWHASFHTHKLTLLWNITKLLGQWKVEEQSLLCGEVITIVDLSPQTHVDGWWRGNQPDNMGCLHGVKKMISLIIGDGLSYASKFFNTSGKWQICASIHCTRLRWSYDIVVVTWESHDLIMYTCLQVWWRSGNTGYGRVFVVIQDQDHNQFILSDEFGSSHTNIRVLRS